MPELEPNDHDRIAKLEQDSNTLPAFLHGEIEKLKAENQLQQQAIGRQQKLMIFLIGAVAASLIGGEQIDKFNETLGKSYQLLMTGASLYAGYKAILEGKMPDKDGSSE